MKTSAQLASLLIWGSMTTGSFAGIAFDDFDGNFYGFSGNSWSDSSFENVTPFSGYPYGTAFQATGDSTAERSTARWMGNVDLSGDTTYYLANFYYSSGAAHDQYAVNKLRNDTAGGPAILWRNNGSVDAYIGTGSTASELSFMPNKLYFCVLKIDCNPTGINDVVFLNLYNISDGESVPATAPNSWQTDGKSGNATPNFAVDFANNIQLIGRGSIDSTFDSVVLSTNWADVVAAAQIPPPSSEVPPPALFTDFDGTDIGFTGTDWDSYALDAAKPYPEYPFGTAFQAYGTGTGESVSTRWFEDLSLRGDTTYYLSTLYYSAGNTHDQYAVCKLRYDETDGPMLLWRNNSSADAHVGSGPTATEIMFDIGKLYFCVLKIECNQMSDDAVYLNLYNLTDGDSIPATDPAIWQTDGLPGNSISSFPVAYVNNIRLIGRGSIASTFDQLVLSTNWNDIVAAGEMPLRGRVHAPYPENEQEKVNGKTLRHLQWRSPTDSLIDSINRYDLYFYGKPTASVTDQDPNFVGITPVDNGKSTIASVTVQEGYTYFWRVDPTITWNAADSGGSRTESIAGSMWSFAVAEGMQELFVATDGDDGNDGTIDDPLATLTGARNRLRSLGVPSAGATVWLRGGRYPVTDSLVLEERDSGREGAPVVYSAYPDEEVIIDGSRLLPSGDFSIVQDAAVLARLNPAGRGNVYSAAITDTTLQGYLQNPSAQLSIDNRMMQQSRFPNVAFDHVRSRDTSTEVNATLGTDSDPKGAKITLLGSFSGDWKSELERTKKARLRGYVSAAWLKETLRLASVDSSNVVQLMDGSAYGMGRLPSMNAPQRCFIDNLLCEIDEPGEWYYDNIENRVYLWPYAGAIDGTTTLGVWTSPKLFDISADNIRIENLTMQCVGIGGSFVDIYSANVVVAGCVMRYSTTTPYNIWSTARNSGLLSCDLYDNDGGGRLYAGFYSNEEIEAGNCFVENCHFTQVDSKSFYGKVAAVKGAGNILRNNLAHNHNGQIVTMSGTDHLVEFNEIFNTGIEEGDGGSIYQGASFSSANNRIRNNFWHHIICIPSLIGRAAIYSDDGDCFDKVTGNVFYKAGTCFKMNKGAGHEGSRNVMIESAAASEILGSTSTVSMYNTDMSHLDSHTSVKDAHLYRAMSEFGIDGWQDTANSSNWNTQITPFWRERYPVLDQLFNNWWADKAMKKYSFFRQNVLYGNNSGLSSPSGATVQETTNLPNLDIFEDPDSLNFKYSAPIPSYATDIPFDHIGLYMDRYRTVVPDKATYRNAVRDHWYGVASKASGSYNPDTINERIYFNTGKLIMDMLVPVDIGIFEVAEDIGSTNPLGSTDHSSGTYTLEGAGADIWQASDAFHFVHKTMEGNSKISARVLSVAPINDWSKAGIMIREDSTPGSKYALLLQRPDKSVSMQWRTNSDTNAENTALTGGTDEIKWLRLTREGTTFTGSYSIDGTTWTEVTSVRLTMDNQLSAGLFVTSHNNGTLCSAVFDDVSIFPIIFANDYDGDGMSNDWEQYYFGDETNAVANVDIDNDQQKNLIEYAFNGHPRDPRNWGVLPSIQVGRNGDADHVFLLRNDPGIEAVTLTTTNLQSGTWTTNLITSGATGNGFTTYTNSLPSENQLFIKMQIRPTL